MNIALKNSARAQIVLRVEIDVSSTWGGDCSISQIHEQAKNEASNTLRRLIASEQNGIRIIGEPEIKVTIIDGRP